MFFNLLFRFIRSFIRLLGRAKILLSKNNRKKYSCTVCCFSFLAPISFDLEKSKTLSHEHKSVKKLKTNGHVITFETGTTTTEATTTIKRNRKTVDDKIQPNFYGESFYTGNDIRKTQSVTASYCGNSNIS